MDGIAILDHHDRSCGFRGSIPSLTTGLDFCLAPSPLQQHFSVPRLSDTPTVMNQGTRGKWFHLPGDVANHRPSQVVRASEEKLRPLDGIRAIGELVLTSSRVGRWIPYTASRP